MKDTSKLDELNESLQRLTTEHQQMKGAYERALKEKTEADEKLAGIQQQWETFMRGV
jgi:chromosome segregation ATPase